MLLVLRLTEEVGCPTSRYEHIRQLSKVPKPYSMPAPFFNVLNYNGGVHSGKTMASQEFMIAPVTVGQDHNDYLQMPRNSKRSAHENSLASTCLRQSDLCSASLKVVDTNVFATVLFMIFDSSQHDFLPSTYRG